LRCSVFTSVYMFQSWKIDFFNQDNSGQQSILEARVERMDRDYTCGAASPRTDKCTGVFLEQNGVVGLSVGFSRSRPRKTGDPCAESRHKVIDAHFFPFCSLLEIHTRFLTSLLPFVHQRKELKFGAKRVESGISNTKPRIRDSDTIVGLKNHFAPAIERIWWEWMRTTGSLSRCAATEDAVCAAIRPRPGHS
jgi:hypothetical protein